MESGYSHTGIDPAPNSPEIPQHFSYPGLDEPKPKRPDNPIGPDGLPQYFSYKPFDGYGHKDLEKDSPLQNPTSRYSHKIENEPQRPTIDDKQQTPATVPPADKEGGTADGAEAGAENTVTVSPENWDAELDKGNYDGVAKSVTDTLVGLGASEAELSTAQSLCNLVSERRNDPSWRKWGGDMLAWIRTIAQAR